MTARQDAWSERLRVTATTVAIGLASSIVVLALWWAFLKIWNVNTLVGKTPLDVALYLFQGPAAAGHRHDLLADLLITLGHASLGFVSGLTAGMVVASSFVLSRTAEQALMPVALILRSVPLIAMTPLIVLIFGRGPLAVTVISGIVVFFPALVNIGLGVRSASRLSADLVRAYGGTSWTFLRKIGIPTALPALFASMRISVPGSLIGALLAEWLATGNGLGYRMQRDVVIFKAADLWSSVVLITVTSLLLYFAVEIIERVVLARIGFVSTRE